MINGEGGRWLPQGTAEAAGLALALIVGSGVVFGMHDQPALIMPAVTLAYGLIHGVGVRLTSPIERVAGWLANLLFVVTAAAMYAESGDTLLTAAVFPVAGWMIMQRGWRAGDGPIWWLLRGVVFRAGPMLMAAGVLLSSSSAYGAPGLLQLVAAAALATALFLGRLFDACEVRATLAARS